MSNSKTTPASSEDLERLTGAIRTVVRSVEDRHPDCFGYDGLSLRGAVERRFYYEALIDATRLGALVSAGTPAKAELLSWLPGTSGPSVTQSMWDLCKSWVRLMYYGLMRATAERLSGRSSGNVASTQMASTQVGEDQPEFVFCTLHPRFIEFFLPIIEKLGKSRCALLWAGGPSIIEEAKRLQIPICSPQSERLQLASVKRPPRAFFPVYSVSVIELLKVRGTLQRARPRVVIFAEAASFQEEVIAQAARSLGVATVRVQHGRAGVISPGYYDMPYDTMLMWGEGFVDRLKATSPGCCFEITGSPLLDKMLEVKLDGPLAKFMDNRPTVTIITQPECVNISRQDYEALVSIVDQVLLANANVNVVVRLHPADLAQDFYQLAQRWPQRMRVTLAQEFALNAVLARTTVIAGLYSTVLSEAVAFGVVPVVIRLGAHHRVFPSPEDAGAAALAVSIDAAVAVIGELVVDPSARASYVDRMQAFTRRYFGPMDGGAVVRIVQHIENARRSELRACAAAQ